MPADVNGPRTATGKKVVAMYGDRLLDDVLGIEAEARADVDGLVALREAARKVLPEVIDADFPSVITSPDSMKASIDRLTGIADRWQDLRALLAGDKAEAPRSTREET